jgi:preprotein translocase subunit SecA
MATDGERHGHVRLVHHVSLEDPMMRMFAGEWVQNVLQRLGMNENEAIESRMVTRRFKRRLRRSKVRQ